MTWNRVVDIWLRCQMSFGRISTVDFCCIPFNCYKLRFCETLTDYSDNGRARGDTGSRRRKTWLTLSTRRTVNHYTQRRPSKFRCHPPARNSFVCPYIYKYNTKILNIWKLELCWSYTLSSDFDYKREFIIIILRFERFNLSVKIHFEYYLYYKLYEFHFWKWFIS